MTQLNGLTAVVAIVAGTSLTLNDVYGNPIDLTAFGAYTSGRVGVEDFHALDDLRGGGFGLSEIHAVCRRDVYLLREY